MSTAIVRAEIQRFLQSKSPEVLCISGRWGVGKTYSWQKYLGEAELAEELSVEQYAYVSLFGINSLAELRNSIVEETVEAKRNLTSLASAATLWRALRRGKRYILKRRPMLDLAAGYFRMKDAGDALYRAAFLGVRGQLICFDDLERAGKPLEMRDILGLASMLREQRGCKVVLLMNKERVAPEQQEELDRQLEKVVDSFLVFEPTSAEAAAIAIEGDDPVAELVRSRLIALDITNIRVMKKVERWARLLEAILVGTDDAIRDQAVSTVTLAGWCFLQRDGAPGFDFLRTFNPVSGLFGDKEVSAGEKKWRELFRSYGYGMPNELDAEIVDGVAAGFFRADAICENAMEVQARLRRDSRDSSFSKAWRLYHQTLTSDDDAVLDALYAGAVENLAAIAPVNVNATVLFLRRYGRDQQASELIQRYMEVSGSELSFFKDWDRFFGNDPVDQELRAAMEAGRAAILDERDPAEVLRRMARSRGFNPTEDIALFSKLSVEELVELLESNPGEELQGMVYWADILSKQPNAALLRANVTSAFAKIAAKSPMRADRLRSWGVWSPEGEPEPKVQADSAPEGDQ